MSQFKVGQRVQISPAYDAWMRGDRYGEIEKITAKTIHVRLDKSKRILRIPTYRPTGIYEVVSEPREQNPRDLRRAPRIQAFRAHVSAASGLLLGGAKKVTSSWFASSADADSWKQTAIETNAGAGRAVGESWIEEKANVPAQMVIGSEYTRQQNPRARKLKWQTFAGGTGAAPGKNSYAAYTGRMNNREMFTIDPISRSDGRHAYYIVRYFGRRAWEELGARQSPNGAKFLANLHWQNVQREDLDNPTMQVKTNPTQRSRFIVGTMKSVPRSRMSAAQYPKTKRRRSTAIQRAAKRHSIAGKSYIFKPQGVRMSKIGLSGAVRRIEREARGQFTRRQRNPIFVGLKDGKRQIFRSRRTPTQSTHGDKFNAVIGPFRTRKGALIMASSHGPQIQTVADAERAARKRNPESHESRELFLFAINDGDLYRSRITPIILNLQRKIKRGVYDKTLALKLWKYAADDAAQRYTKQFDAPNPRTSYGIFTVEMRQDAARQMQDYYDQHVQEGNVKKNPRRRAQNPARAQRMSAMFRKWTSGAAVEIKSGAEWITLKMFPNAEAAKKWARRFHAGNSKSTVRVVGA